MTAPTLTMPRTGRQRAFEADTQTRRRRNGSAVPVGVAMLAAYLTPATFGVDTFYALYTGRLVASSGPPHHEVLTAAAARTWVDQQWLGQWVFFEVFRLVRYPGLVLFCMALATATGVLLARLIAVRTGQSPVLWAALAIWTVGVSTAFDRTQLLAYPLFIALLRLVTSAIRRRAWHRSAALVPLVLIAWANIHGSVLLGAAIAGAVFAWLAVVELRARRPKAAGLALVVAATSVAAVLATPYGISILGYYRSLIGNSAIQSFVPEWQRTLAVGGPGAWSFVAMLLLAGAALIRGLRQRRRTGWQQEMLLAATLTVLGFYSHRYVAWAAIVVAYVAASHGGNVLPHKLVGARSWKRVSYGGRVVATAFLLVMGLTILTAPTADLTAQPPNRLAAAATETFSQRPGDTVLADPATATAMLWMHPNTQGHVAFDIRYEQYKSDDLLAYWRYLSDRNPRLACRYGIVAISAKSAPTLVNNIRADVAWTATYDGKDGIVAVRTPGTTCA